MMDTYRVLAERSGNWWAIEVPGVPGALSQAKRLDQVEEMARDAIALILEVPEDSFAVDVVPVVNDEELERQLADYHATAEEATAAASRVRRERAQSARMLTYKGYSRRDAAVVLGTSYQRVQQLLAEPVD